MNRVLALAFAALLATPSSLVAQCCVAEGVDEAPIPLNGDAVADSLLRVAEGAPPDWIGRRMEAWVHVGEGGSVLETRVARSSGDEQLDEVLLGVVELMRFSPSITEGEPVDAWIRFPVVLETRSSP